MKKLILSIVLFLLAFLVFLVATVPAKLAVSYLPQPSPIQVRGVSGTIWSGEAASLVHQNNDLGKLEWTLKPLTLLTMKLGVDFRLSQKHLFAEGEATISQDQSISLDDTTIKGDVAHLPLPEDKLLVTPEGRFVADITNATIVNQNISDVDGNLVWSPAKITAPAEYELGKITLDVTGTDGQLNGKLGSKNSPLNIAGTLQLAKNGNLSTNIKLTPHNQTPQEIRDMLPLAGKPARDGSVTIKQRIRLR